MIFGRELAKELNVPHKSESVVYGVNAALALAQYRPQSIIRVYHNKERRLEVAPLLKCAAAAHRPYREVTDEELEKIAQTVHHEGVVVVAEPLSFGHFEHLLEHLTTHSLIVALDVVGNPHNLGSILRSAAWFGADAVLMPAEAGQATVSPAAIRIAQGGAELVDCIPVPDLPRALAILRERKIAIIAADQAADRNVIEKPLHRPCCIVLGNEHTGLSPATREQCHVAVAIPGKGTIESLNVAVSAGILLAMVK